MPFTRLLTELDSGHKIGKLERDTSAGAGGWDIRDGDGRSMARFEDRSRGSWPIRVIGAFFGDRPDDYQVTARGQVIATMQRENPEPSETTEPPASGLKGLTTRLGNALRSRDWVLREQQGGEGRIDPRLLIAGMLLLERVNRDSAD